MTLTAKYGMIQLLTNRGTTEKTNTCVFLSYREDVVQTVFDDLNGTDTDLQIEALHLIPHLPGIVFIVS